MDTRFIEVTNGSNNWGKFSICCWDSEEWQRESNVSTHSLLRQRGWTPKHIWVLDLETGEGACFLPGGSSTVDLDEKHRIWTCPLFPYFLEWLYAEVSAGKRIKDLPSVVDLPHAPFSLSRRRGAGCCPNSDSTFCLTHGMRL